MCRAHLSWEKRNSPLANRTIASGNGSMTGNESIRKVKTLGKRRDVERQSPDTLFWKCIYDCSQPKGRTKDGNLSCHVLPNWH